MDWKTLWTRFRGTFYFRIVYLVLVALLGALSLATTIACFAVLIIPALTLLVPHWFGERRMKHHALNGVLVLILATVFFGLLVTPGYASQSEYVLSGDGARLDLSDGIVLPFRANPGARNFNFTITMWTNDSAEENFTLSVEVLSLVGFAVAPQNVTMTHDVSGSDNLSNGDFGDGERFFANVPLEPFAHSYSFQAVDTPTGTRLLVTPRVPGPFHAEYGTYLALWLFNGFFNMILIILGFYLVLMLYWWTRRAREMRGSPMDRGKKRDEGGGEYTCTNCGGDVSEADTKCPNCGAEFGPRPESREPAEAKP